MFEDFGINAGFVEDLHAQYRQSRQSVDEEWRAFFDGLERGAPGEAPATANGHANGAHPAASAGNGHTNGNGAHALAPYSAPAMPAIVDLLGTNGARDERLLAAAAVQGRVYQLVN